ncbi:MAG: alkaline phosphatase family protein [Christensenellaceae bacterium]|nr:alkaline phosphatase family protein [Christensenellaceae bacterium]
MALGYNSLSIAQVAGSVAAILGIEPPTLAAGASPLLVRAAREAFHGLNADRAFLYNPDAIALWLFQKYTALFEEALLRSRLQLPLRSVMPSVTPVCFASMYTGAQPAVHGIQAYEKPVLKIDTLFDALLRAGKKPAIVSTTGDSVSMIFLEREMDYFIFDTPEECNEKALTLIERDEHDAIILYNADFDATMHRYSPESPEALQKLRLNSEVFAAMHERIGRCWQKHRTFIGYCPDHGCHAIDGGLGSHGLEVDTDMDIIHLYDFIG